MNINLLIRGIIIGVSIAAPVGPISVITIRRTLAKGRASGLASGVGAATADVIYGSIAGFGLTFISDLLIGQQLWVRLIGGLFLCYLGLKTFLLDPATQTAPVQGSGSVSGLVGAYASTFFLTLTNPMTIFTFAAVYALRGVYFALLEETKIAGSLTGTAVGMISLIGYTPDAFFNSIAGRVLDASPGLNGFQNFFLMLAFITLIGMIATMMLAGRKQGKTFKSA